MKKLISEKEKKIMKTKVKYCVIIFKDGKWRKCVGLSISVTEFNEKGWTKSLTLAKQLKDSLSKQFPKEIYRIVEVSKKIVE